MSNSNLPYDLQRAVEQLSVKPEPPPFTIDEFADAFLSALEQGTIRAAEPQPDGSWRVHTWVKQGILLLFRHGRMVPINYAAESFFDKHTLPPQRLSAERGVRLVPGGSTIRRGAYVAPGVICMPPMYINVGAFVDEGTMVDSHVLVGTCAQIGRNVHLSAGAQIGGVLEPANAQPVIIEDEVFIGGNTGIYEGTLIRRRAVIAAGVILTASVPVFDLVYQRILRAAPGHPLEIPSGAVVVPGTRKLDDSSFAQQHGLAASCALIVKYRDERTDQRTALETTLRR
ncbi:MAG: 2,3,4,5-tetrahydropyridine-2,6-dicarboxylate N-succinyltransferase [Bacteroidota bacterium]|nr:2,3,4,5-tetrahydropyridine-2,6-dicarboxylate N-succinyltransferase [Candidatus Kapabacteria bacterium]MDW8074677.1 2,3,4,5-tetrahydropyridine-2,6-dicarboxylate N-succinyltransferase [Bacteroidota bacterium]